jgi:hypothetical protein
MTDTALLVPIELTALWRQNGQPGLLTTAARFCALPFVWKQPSNGLVAANAGTPYLSGVDGFLAPPFQETDLALADGLHLHWLLPEALTVRRSHGGSPAFPAVPNRWLVTRSHQGSVEQQWVVESDYLNPEPATMDQNYSQPCECEDGIPPVAISYPVRHEQGEMPYRSMGRSMTLDDYLSHDFTGDEYLPQRSDYPLTAVGFGEPLFAALYPNCFSVFGFCDTDALTAGDEYTYDLLGWYAAPQSDCLGFFASLRDPAGSLLSEYEWKVDGTGPLPTRTICFARLTLTPQALASSGPAPGQVSLAAGHTGAEALAAYLASQLDAGHQATYEEQLEALRSSALLAGHHVDLGARFQEVRHRKGFKAVHGGTRWAVKRAGQDGSDPSAPLPPALADALLQLNRAQELYDQACQVVASLRRQLFSDWYQYLEARYPPAVDTTGWPLPDDARDFARDHSLPPLQDALTAAGSLESEVLRQLAAVRAVLAALAEPLLLPHGQPLAVELYELVRRPAPRYWQPAEPVVLMAGPGAALPPPLVADGPLPCHRLDVTIPAKPGKALLGQIRAALDALPTGPGLQTQTAPPWHPVALEWQVEVYPVTQNGPEIKDDDSFTYLPEYVTASATLADRAVDLDLNKSALPSLSGTMDVYSGRTVLSPHAGEQIGTYLAAYLENLTLLDCREDAGEQQAAYDKLLLAWYTGVCRHTGAGAPNPQDEGFSDELAAWAARQHPFLLDGTGGLASASDLASWYPQKPVANGTFGQLPADQQAQDPVWTAIRAYGLLPQWPVLSQSLGGFNAALLMHRQVLQLPVADPLADPKANPEDYKFTQDVARLVAGDHRTAPDETGVFLPIRQGLMRLDRLRLIDCFGQTLDLGDLTSAPVVRGETLTPPDAAPADNHLLLRPRLAQPARLRFDWLPAGPADTPVCGWLLPNHLDASLMVYDNAGTPLGSLQPSAQGVAWEPAPGTDVRLAVSQIPNPFLRRLVRYLASLEAGFFQASFLPALDEALENIEPQSFAQHQALALLIGRPLAVVRVRLGFELQGLAAVNASWAALQKSFDGSPRVTNGFEKVLLPIRVGEYEQLDDGLVGYWIEADGGYQGNVFYAPQTVVPAAQPITAVQDGPAPSIATRSCLLRSLADPPLTLTMLMDPRGKLHATSGVLPTEVLEIPQSQYAGVLDRLAVTFLTSPVLTGGDEIGLPLPTEPGYSWSFVTLPDGAHWQETTTIAKVSPHARFGAPPRIVEGWLKLKPQSGKGV